MSYQTIRALVKDDLQAVENETYRQFKSEIELANELGQHIISSGGKRLRALVVLLSTRALNYQGDNHIKLASIIECIHTATLLHDDVVDKSSLRRGQETANTIWGNSASVLVGDYIYSRSFQMMVEIDDMQVMAILANASNTIAGGEIQQLMYCHNTQTNEQQYLETINKKTAALFSAASETAAVLSQTSPAQQKAQADYGQHLGMAFQLIDDILDYQATDQLIGKQTGDDLAEGKLTLPLIYALQHASTDEKKQLEQAIEQGSREDFETISQILQSTKALDYAFAQARKQTELAITALETLAPSPYKDALFALAKLALNRKQ